MSKEVDAKVRQAVSDLLATPEWRMDFASGVAGIDQRREFARWLCEKIAALEQDKAGFIHGRRVAADSTTGRGNEDFTADGDVDADTDTREQDHPATAAGSTED